MKQIVLAVVLMAGLMGVAQACDGSGNQAKPSGNQTPTSSQAK